MVLGENNRSYETSSHNLPCSNEPFTLTYMHQTPYDVAILVEAWLEPGMDIRRLSHTVSSPTLTDPDMILPDQTSWPLPLSISKPSYSVRSRSPVSKDGQSALPGVTRISVLGPKTPSLSSTKGIEIKPKQATPYGEDTLAFPGTLRAKTQHKTSTDPESALESGLSDGDISIRSENLDEIKWPGLDSDSVDGASVFSEEDTVHEGDNVSGAIVADQDKLAQFKRGSKRDEELDLHTAMSQKAELILANAKKKLNLMEDNLRRTRRSFIDTPQASLGSLRTTSSSSEEMSTPGYGSSERLMYPGFGFAPSRQRLLHSRSLSSLGSSGHLRGMSENTIPTVRRGSGLMRNSSADEPGTATASRSRHEGSYSGPRLQGRFVKTSRSEESMLRNRYADYNTPHGRSADREKSPVASLTPLKEDGLPAGEDSVSQSFKLRRRSRTRSMTQTSGLREQMRELQGRIISLQKRAREDGLRRRSLQNLRQTTPLAAGAMLNSGAHASHVRGVPRNEHTPAETGSQHYIERHGAESRTTKVLPINDGTGSITVSDNEQNEDGSVYEETLEYGAYSTVEERHEDRSDAFDYEHSFLHSGMGSYSQQNSNRRDSISSTDSGETTHSPNEQHVEASPRVRGDRNATRSTASSRGSSRQSVASVSTLASFTTAVSGYESARASGERSQSDRNGEPGDAASYPALTVRSAHDVLPKSLRAGSAHSNYSSTSDVPTPTIASFPLPTKSSSEATVNQRPQSIIFASLLGAASKPALTAALSSQDKDLVFAVAESLQQVCLQLQRNGEDPYGSGVWRRRLEEARRVLEGEGEEDQKGETNL